MYAVRTTSASPYGHGRRGRADAAYSRGEHIEIEDYKTGGIHDEVPGAGVMLKPHFRRQLLLYAAIHHNETEEWPATGSVVPLSCFKERFPLDPVEAKQEASAALAVRAASNNERARTSGAAREAGDANALCM